MTAPPTSLNGLEIRRRLGRGIWSTPTHYGPDGWSFTELSGDGTVIVTVAPCGDDNADWIHASITRAGRTPSYEDLKLLHQAVFVDRWAYQLFAPPADHVNIHAHALHLFGRLDGRPALPDFTYGTGSI